MLDLEPPSPRDQNGDKDNSEWVKKIHTNIKAFRGNLQQTGKKMQKGLYFLSQKIELARVSIRIFFKKMISNKLLPHLVIAFLFFIVAFSNINDRVQAYYLTHQINSLDPNIELAVVSDVDRFTPHLDNSAKAVEDSITSANYSSGFAYNAAPTDTQITTRTEPLPDNSSQTVYYAVRNGDTMSAIGWAFGVKIATLAYLNDLSNNDLIKPGQKLKIPPRGYEVSATIIAQKQAAAFAAAEKVKAKTAAQKLAISRPAGSIRNAYPYGYCTYYVATRRAVPASWGNGGQWLNSAKRAGYSTGSSAVSGAIVVTRESFWGHVAYVESVSGDQMTISEMNAPIFGVRTTRTISTHDSKIKGFIY